MKKYILTIALGFIFVMSLMAQSTRRVHWVHGMESSSSFWQTYKSDFEYARQINSGGAHNYSWSTSNGVVSFSNNIRYSTVSDANAIAIGHKYGWACFKRSSKI